MSRSRDVSPRSPIARCGKFIGIGLLASLLVLSAGHAQKAGPSVNNGGNNATSGGNGNNGGGQSDNQGQTRGEAGADRALRLLTLVPVPVSNVNTTAGAMYSFDISYVDQATQTYYLADRSNKAVDVIDAKTSTFTKQIFASFKGFTPCSPPAGANDCSGPNGVVAHYPWLFVTDGGSRVVSINLKTDVVVSDVTTASGDNKRADELAYDPQHGTLLVINNADDPPFGTLISVDKTTGKLTVGKRITFDAAH